MKRLPVLPTMRCDTDCGECCSGPVACSDRDYQKLMAYAEAHNVTPLQQDMVCPFYQGGRCAVHEAKPLTCKMFGHAETLVCPQGYNVNLNRTDRRAWERFIAKDKASGTIRFLYEAAYPKREAARMALSAFGLPYEEGRKILNGMGLLEAAAE